MKAEYQPPPANEQKRDAHAALEGALRYASEGFRIIWVLPRTRKPVVNDWPHVATSDAATIQRWAAEHPGCNFGLAMGATDLDYDFVAIDVDDAGMLENGKMPYLPPTRTHKTPSGGFHFIYRVPKGTVLACGNTVEGLFAHVDIRTQGGQVVCPGSVALIKPELKVLGTYIQACDLPASDLPEEWLRTMNKPSRKAAAPAQPNGNGPIPPGDQDVRLFKLAAAMQRQGASEDAKVAAMWEEVKRFEQRPGAPWTEKDLRRIARSSGKYPTQPDAAAFNDERPKVFMPSEGLPMAEVAITLARPLREHLFAHNREIVEIDGTRLHFIEAQEFRTLVQKFVVCLRERQTTGIRPTTMTDSEARGLLASPQLREGLRTVARVNTVRLPVLRQDGRAELLPEGYDEATQTWTASWMTYAEDMPFATAIDVVRDLFRDFSFADPERSLSVAVAAMMAPFAAQLVSRVVVRPIFVVDKNAPGAGAGTILSCCLVPVMGGRPTGTFPHEEAEMRKRLTSEVRAGSTVIVFDNVTGLFDSQELAAFTTLALWRDRGLGTNEMYEGENNAIVYATMNNAAVSEQMGRRSLFMELHLAEERAEDRTFVRELNTDTLRAMAPGILAACWALVRNWDTQGRPGASRINSNFPEWSRVLGGIVEAAGFGCPLARADVAEHADANLQAMRALVAVMEVGRRYSFQDILERCRREEIFLENNGDPDPRTQQKREASEEARLGLLLASYGRPPGRRVGNYRFLLAGANRTRRYYIEAVTIAYGAATND